jgi:hypothetical protein
VRALRESLSGRCGLECHERDENICDRGHRDDEFRLTLTPDECRTIVNCMKATFEDNRGEGIAAYEYRTRVGASMETGKQAISAIEAVLPS